MKLWNDEIRMFIFRYFDFIVLIIKGFLCGVNLINYIFGIKIFYFFDFVVFFIFEFIVFLFWGSIIFFIVIGFLF